MGLSLTFWQVLIVPAADRAGGRRCSTACRPRQWPLWPSATALIATIYTGAIPIALGTATWFALVKLLPAQVAALLLDRHPDRGDRERHRDPARAAVAGCRRSPSARR